jgi:hypothetical protein
MKLEFFKLLYGDSEFCEALGQMTLASGRFESDLRKYLRFRGIKISDQAGLGTITGELKKQKMISENGVHVLRTIKLQRNYLTHSLFDLFSERVEETILPRSELVPADKYTFIEKVEELNDDLVGLSEIVEKKLKAYEHIRKEAIKNDESLLFIS